MSHNDKTAAMKGIICLLLVALVLSGAAIWHLTRQPAGELASPVPQVLVAGPGVELLAGGEDGSDCVEVRIMDGLVEYRGTACTTAPTPTPTSLPDVTPSPTPLPGDHDDTAWHPLTEEFAHHHGVNPADYAGIFGDTLTNYLDEYGSISYPWQTPNENAVKHTGYIWLYTQAEDGCEHYKQTGKTDANCVTDVLVQVHSIGTPMATITRNHSFVLFARICDLETQTQCGVVMTGGWHDYGFLHCPYKGAHCPLETDPAEISEEEFMAVIRHQPPYRTNHPMLGGPPNAPEIVQFWSSFRPNPTVADLYPHQPNWMAGLAWSSHDAWGLMNPDDPHNSPLYCPDGSCHLNHSRFQIFAVELYDLPAGPFTGWTNRWGHLVEGCNTAGLDCVPFVVTAGMPAGDALLNRQVDHGNPNAAPILEFDNGMGWLLPPDMPPMEMDE